MRSILVLLLALLFVTNIYSQKEEASDTSVAKIWTTGGGLGLDLSQLLLSNPKVGAGDNRFAFGGLGNFFATYKKDKIMWENAGSLQLAVQRVGNSDNPFEKNLDLLRLGSKIGYQLKSPIFLLLLNSPLRACF